MLGFYFSSVLLLVMWNWWHHVSEDGVFMLSKASAIKWVRIQKLSYAERTIWQFHLPQIFQEEKPHTFFHCIISLVRHPLYEIGLSVWCHSSRNYSRNIYMPNTTKWITKWSPPHQMQHMGMSCCLLNQKTVWIKRKEEEKRRVRCPSCVRTSIRGGRKCWRKCSHMALKLGPAHTAIKMPWQEGLHKVNKMQTYNCGCWALS